VRHRAAAGHAARVGAVKRLVFGVLVLTLGTMAPLRAQWLKLPTAGIPLTTWNGYSVGRWDGDALVVEIVGFRDDLWLDVRGSPLTSAAKVRERMRRPDFGHLNIEVTVDDPKAYTRPWTVTLRQQIIADTEIIDEFCLENERFGRRVHVTP